MEKNISEISHVIKIKDRYFYKFGKGNRVMTAWCLTGAATYQDHNVIGVFDKLVGLGKKPVIVKIGAVVEPKTILQIAEEAHQDDICNLSVDIASIKDSLKQGLTLEDYLEKQEQLLKLYSGSAENEDFNDEIPF